MCVCVSQKIQSELSGHDATLEDMRKKNQDKEPLQRTMGQIDLTQVHKHTEMVTCRCRRSPGVTSHES